MTGADAFDGGLPPALDAASDVRIAFVGTDGETRGQESRAYDAATAVAPLALRIAGRPDGTTYRLAWPTDNLPAGWAVALTDGDTGETVDLRTADHYDFAASAGDWASRFTVRVAARTTAGEAEPTVAAVGAPSPNPASGQARVTLSVDQPQRVRADLFDALGRRVAVVLDASVDARRDPVGGRRGSGAGRLRSPRQWRHLRRDPPDHRLALSRHACGRSQTPAAGVSICPAYHVLHIGLHDGPPVVSSVCALPDPAPFRRPDDSSFPRRSRAPSGRACCIRRRPRLDPVVGGPERLGCSRGLF